MGGMQRVSIQLLHALQENEEVTVHPVILHAPWKGVEKHVAQFMFRLLFELPRMVRDTGADAVLFSSMVTASLSVLLRKRIDVPLITINHGQDVTLPSAPYQWLVPKVFRALDGVISVSEATRQESIKRGLNPADGVAIGNGFDPNYINRLPDADEAQKELEALLGQNLDKSKLLLTVGRQVPRKGHAWFIREVLPKLDKEMIYAAIGDGPEHETLQQIREESPERDRIHLLGKQPDEVLLNAYRAADLFVMPNIPVPGDMEGFGIVILEANLAKTPVVASNLEGMKDVVEPGRNGTRVEPLQSGTFAEAITELVNGNLEAMKEKSFAYVTANYSWHKISRSYLSFIKEKIDEHNIN